MIDAFAHFELGPLSSDELNRIRHLIGEENHPATAERMKYSVIEHECCQKCQSSRGDGNWYITLHALEYPNLMGMALIYQQYLIMRDIPRGYFTYKGSTPDTASGGVVVVSRGQIHIVDAVSIGEGFLSGLYPTVGSSECGIGKDQPPDCFVTYRTPDPGVKPTLHIIVDG